MAVSEIVVEWFVPIVLLSMVATAVVVIIRRRGHLHLGRPLKKREAAVILIILAWQFTFVLPALNIVLFIYNTYGELPGLEFIAELILALGQTIPLVIASGGFVLFLATAHRNWGAAGSSLLTGVVFSAVVMLTARGFAYAAIEMIVDLVPSLLSGLILSALGLLVMALLCMKPSVTGTTDKVDEKRRLPQYSSSAKTASLKLLVGLGKRVLVDGDSSALQVLSEVYHKNAYTEYIIGAAAKDAALTLSDAILDAETESARSSLAPLMRPFGTTGKRLSRFVQVSVIIDIALVVLMLYLLVFASNILLGVLLILPVVLLLLPMLVLPQTTSYGPDKHSIGPVAHWNSYLLTEAQFKRRSAIDRSLFVFALTMIGFQVYSILRVYESFDWYWAASGILIVVALLLISGKDHVLHGSRLDNEETVRRALEYIHTPEADETEKALTGQLEESGQTQYQAGQEVSVSADWKQRLERLGFEKFAKRVEENSTEVYEENTFAFHFLAPSGAFLLVGSIGTFMFSGTILQMMAPFTGLILGVGLLVFVPGLVKWLSIRRRHQSLGIARKQLALTATCLDLKAQGVESPGQIMDFPFPSEYFGLGLQGILGSAMRLSLVHSITRLGSEVPWPIEDARRIGPESIRSEAMGVVAGTLICVVSAALTYFITIPGEMSVKFGLILPAFAVLGLVIALWAAVRWARTKSPNPPWLRGTMLSDGVQPIDTLRALLKLLTDRYRSPLRTLVLGEYPELAYTGRVYRTTNGLQLKEGIFIPSQ